MNTDPPATEARAWTEAGVDPADVEDFIELGLTPAEAATYATKGVRPYQITRTDSGYAVELEPWQEDPVDQLPKVIEPGRISLSLWAEPLWGDDYLESDVVMTWDGGHTVDWSVVSGSGLGMASSVSFHGIAGWPNGKDVHLSCYSGDVGVRGAATLIGAAPTSSGATATNDPQSWVNLAQKLVWLADEFDDSNREDCEYAAEYHRPADDWWGEFDDLFLQFLESADPDGSLPSFDSWLADALETGTYQPGDGTS